MDNFGVDLEQVECMKLNLEQAKRMNDLKRKLQEQVERMKHNIDHELERVEDMKRGTYLEGLEFMKRLIDPYLEGLERMKRNLEGLERMIFLEQEGVERMKRNLEGVERMIDLERMKRYLKRKLERMKRIVDRDYPIMDPDHPIMDLEPIIDLERMIDEFVRCFLLLGLEGLTALFRRERCSRLSKLIDVYIKDKEPLVKRTLTTQLYNTLDLLDLRVFLENALGNSFSSIMKIAIHSAKVHIAIFSKRSGCFADVDLSKMAEVVRMLESNCKSIPVFYQEELQKLRQRNCQMSKNPVRQGLHNQVKEFKRRRFGQLVQNLEKQCTLQRKKRRKP